jgi:hypothetical protein
MRAFPDGKSSPRAGAFADDAFNVRNLRSRLAGTTRFESGSVDTQLRM